VPRQHPTRGGGSGSVTSMSDSKRLLLDLEPHGPDVYVGESPDYPWGRIYGGLVVAQALKAAGLTVDPGYAVHSLHSYFILGGVPTEPVRYEVDRIRNGRSFTTRRVVARQSGGAILNLSASFHVAEEGVDVQQPDMPAVPGPEGLESLAWGEAMDARIALVDRGTARSVVWARYPEVLPEDPLEQACAFAYMSDANPMDAIEAGHPEPPADGEWHGWYMNASLDHSIWFHRGFDAGDWLLFDMRSQGLVGNRGLAFGSVFTSDGRLVASIAQEGLLRRVRPR